MGVLLSVTLVGPFGRGENKMVPAFQTRKQHTNAVRLNVRNGGLVSSLRRSELSAPSTYVCQAKSNNKSRYQSHYNMTEDAYKCKVQICKCTVEDKGERWTINTGGRTWWRTEIQRETETERHPLCMQREGAQESAGASKVHNREERQESRRGVVITAVYPDRIS